VSPKRILENTHKKSDRNDKNSVGQMHKNRCFARRTTTTTTKSDRRRRRIFSRQKRDYLSRRVVGDANRRFDVEEIATRPIAIIESLSSPYVLLGAVF
jgi:hypothetical protein